MGESTLDIATFRELQKSSGDDFVVELIEAFAEESPGLLEQLWTSRDSSDARSFSRAAHSLKSNARAFGACALAEMARALEAGGAAAGDDAALNAISREHGLALEALRRAVDDG